MSTLTEEQRHAVYFQLGPWLIGVCVDLLLQGIVLTQVANYFGCYREDKRVRMIVAILGLLTLVKSAQGFAIIWIQLMVHYDDLEGAILLNLNGWWEHSHPLMVAGIGLYVQCFFCFRLWLISKSWLVVSPSVAIFLSAVSSITVAMYLISDANVIGFDQWFTAYLSAVFAGNLILSSTTAYFLLKVKTNCHPQRVGLLSAVVRLTFQTAAPATVCAMLNLIFDQVYTGDDGVVATAFDMAMPKLYAISMMWTLKGCTNIRRPAGDERSLAGGPPCPCRLSADSAVRVLAQSEKGDAESV
ncbi:hypothetical protein B0H13DRAFT_2013390 [Mycena leptocephala]|nr:hypothetical protein B0H13DRAFT_2013390 [Mycena leptocephala]